VLTVWALRRRRARRMTRWDRTAQAVQRTGAQARDRLRDAAAELQATVRESDLAAQARDRLRDKAAELQAAVRDSDLAAQAQERGQAAAAELAARTRQAAEAPETKPRAQGAAAAVGLLLVLGCLRARASRRRQRTE
jgi:uncharacterized protein YhaN